MKYLIFSVMFLASLSFIGQSESTVEEENTCERLVTEAISQMEKDFSTLGLDSIQKITEKLVYTCGTSELTQRCLIVKSISESKPTAELVQDYLDSGLQYDLARRQSAAQEHDYGYRYTREPGYFYYFPLRHKLDSLIEDEVYELMNLESITDDEKLICVLFSKGLESFKLEIKKRRYRKTGIKRSMYTSYRQYGDYYMRYNFHSGVVQPLKTDDVFGLNPFVGFSISSPMEYKTVVDFGFRLRMNINDRKFNYYAIDRLNEVDSETNLSVGFSVSRRINNNQKLRIYPKVGIGLEVIDTGLSKTEEGDEDKTHYNLETVGLTTGISALSPVFKTAYIGIGINYHFNPYSLDKNLKTPITSNLISTELFYRF